MKKIKIRKYPSHEENMAYAEGRVDQLHEDYFDQQKAIHDAFHPKKKKLRKVS